MDVVTLSRVPFTRTIMFRDLFPPLTIGLSVVPVYLEGRSLWTQDRLFERAVYQRRPGYAFLSSSATIAALVFLFGIALYPDLVTSNPNPEHNRTIDNAASSEKTLIILAIIAAVGMPLVRLYIGLVYRTFSGKVTLDRPSY